MKCLDIFNIKRIDLRISTVLFMCLLGPFLSNAQFQTIQPDQVSEKPIPITRWGIKLNYIQEGNGREIKEGDFVFCRFKISYKDSTLNESGPIVLDNVVFIPFEYEYHPNAPIYDVFAHLKSGTLVSFEMPFKLLPWKDQILQDEDSIQYWIAIDSVKSEAEYLLIYEKYVDDIESNLEKNTEEFIQLKEQIKNAISNFKDHPKQSLFKKHKQEYWFWDISKLSSEKGKHKHTVRFKYMTLSITGETWDEQFFNPLYMDVRAEEKTLPDILEMILFSMKSGEQKCVLFDQQMIKYHKLMPIEDAPDYLIFWFEILE
jgi:hypothetical protein